MSKNNYQGISNPDELNKRLQKTSPVTWIILGIVIAILASFFAWSVIHKINIRLFAKATVIDKNVTLHINDSDLNKLKVNQKVYISGKEGKILSFDESNNPVVSEFDLKNDEYTCYIVIKQMRPVDFLIGK